MDWKAQFDFIAKTYARGKNYILNNKEFFEWFFFNPFAKGKSSFMVIKKGEEIISEMGFVPTKLKFFEKTINNTNLVNLMALEEYRGRGTGYFLYKEVEKFADVCTNTGYGPLVYDFIDNMGWNKMLALQRFVFILNEEKTSKLAKKLTPKSILPEKTEEKNKSFERIKQFGQETEVFWKKVKNRYPITIERSQTYLNWRFANHPIISYHCLEAKKEEELLAFIVLHFEEAEGFKIARIIDFVSTDEAEQYSLQQAIKYCEENKADLIDFFFTGDFHVESLKKTGFKEANKKPYSLIPILFNPIDRKRKNINFAFKLVNEDLYDERINDINNWYITKGDGDQDRPN